MRKLLILGSMDEFCALVEHAKARGIYTVVCDGYAHGPAKAIADEAYDIDPRKTDEIADLCMRLGIDAAFGTFSDLLAECLVDICYKAGLPCYAEPERFATLREKTKMKRMFEELGVPTPAAVQVHRESIARDIAGLHPPFVMKPVNGYGSRGVYVVNSVEEIAERFEETISYSSFDHLIVEEYSDGHEFNMMNWILDGEPITLSVADREKTHEDPFAVPHVSRIVYPSRFTDDVLAEAREIVRKVAAHVGIETGPLCMQFFWSPESGLKVCECAGRIFGYEHELLELSGGPSLEELILDHLFDREALAGRLHDHDPHLAGFAAGLYFHGREGEVGDVSMAEALVDDPAVVDALVYYARGERISHGVGAKPYAVRYYLKAASRAELDEATERIYDACRVLDGAGVDLLLPNRMEA